MRSFHTVRKWNSATTANAGLDNGRMIRQKQPHREQPSSMADSSSSLGMPMKNWRNRKMLNALPNHAGTQSGLNVPIQPISLK